MGTDGRGCSGVFVAVVFRPRVAVTIDPRQRLHPCTNALPESSGAGSCDAPRVPTPVSESLPHPYYPWFRLREMPGTNSLLGRLSGRRRAVETVALPREISSSSCHVPETLENAVLEQHLAPGRSRGHADGKSGSPPPQPRLCRA